MLTALRMDAVWILERLKEADPKIIQRAQAMRDLIDETIESVRSLAIRLRPGILDTLGLVDALEWHTTEFKRRTEMTCIFEHQDMPAIKEKLATATYRIAQEALTNAARHARASIVKVNLQQRDNRLILTVADNGAGFQPSALSESDGLGIAGMRERARLVGGLLEIQSQPGSGTQIRFQAPISASKGRSL
jgi:signal transduction histidine kinase